MQIGVTNRRRKPIQTHKRNPVSVNMLKSPRMSCNVILQHQGLPRVAYFQLSSSGKNNITTSDVAINPVLC